MGDLAAEELKRYEACAGQLCQGVIYLSHRGLAISSLVESIVDKSKVVQRSQIKVADGHIET